MEPVLIQAAGKRLVRGKNVRADYGKRFATYQDVVATNLLRSGGRLPNAMRARMGELKNLDTVSVSQIIAAQATAVVTLLNGVAQGTTALTRLGRSITMKSILLRISLGMAATTAGASPIRILVVYDKQTNGVAPIATDVLVSDNIYDANNLNNSRRFVTLIDHVIPVLGTSGPQAYLDTVYKKLNHVVEFNNGSAGTVGDIQTGSVYMFVWQSGALITANPLGGIKCRIRFADM